MLCCLRAQSVLIKLCALEIKNYDCMDVKQIAKGIIDGLASIPEGVFLSAVRTIEGSGIAGRDLKIRNAFETERFMRMLKSIATNQEPLRQLISIVITDFYSKLDENGKKAISEKIGYAEAKAGSRMGAQFALSQYVATRIITVLRTSKAMSRLIRVASGFTLNILLLQGVIEEAARASRRMRIKYPVTYMKVSPMNLDMVYFLVEVQLEPYLLFINSHPLRCKGIENELCRLLAR